MSFSIGFGVYKNQIKDEAGSVYAMNCNSIDRHVRDPFQFLF